MNWQGVRGALKHLGRLHGRGDLLVRGGEQSLGAVTYEIDGFLCRGQRSDNGRIEGDAQMLARAFHAGGVCISLSDRQLIDVVLSDPKGGATAEVKVRRRFPEFGTPPAPSGFGDSSE